MKNIEFRTFHKKLLGGVISAETSNEIADFSFIGYPLDLGYSFRTGYALSPDEFRYLLQSDNFECTTELGQNLIDCIKVKDHGNIEVHYGNLKKSLEYGKEVYKDLLTDKKPFFTIGGNHSITIPLGFALEEKNIPFYTFYFDAHLDLYDRIGGTKYSHASVMRRLTELNMFKGGMMIGYRDYTREHIQFAEDKELKLLSSRELEKISNNSVFNSFPDFNSPCHIHFSIDLDVLDPSVSPGVGNPVAGGISTRKLLMILEELCDKLKYKSNITGISWDFVEFIPTYDISNITGFAMIKLFIESLGFTNNMQKRD